MLRGYNAENGDTDSGEEEERHHGEGRIKTFARYLKEPQGVESVAYELPETQQFIEYLERSREKVFNRHCKGVSRWLWLGVVGAFTGLVAVVVEMGLENLFLVREWLNDQVVDSHAHVGVQYAAFVGVSLAFVSVAAFLVCFVEVLAAGSGIPEIKCYLNGIRIPNVVGLKALVAKWFGIIFSVAAGLPCGKEGPMIHSGAIIGAIVTRLQGQYKNFRTLRLAREHRDMVAAGAAAGVAAAFNAPLGGVLFAVEEGASHMDPVILVRVFLGCEVAAGANKVLNPRLNLGSAPVSFGRFYAMNFNLIEVIVFAMMGIVGGLLGAAFVAGNKRLALCRTHYVGPRGLLRFVEALLVTLLISSITFWVPIIANGSSPARFPHRFVIPANQSECEHTPSVGGGESGELHGDDRLGITEALFWRQGPEAMSALFHHCGDDFEPFLLFVFASLNLILACLTYGLGVPSGLFIPMLLTGSAFGRLLGQGLQAWSLHAADAGIYALVGAASMLAGTARITISLATILMECTGDAGHALPVFIAVIFAKWTGDLFNRGIYDMHIIELKRVPILEKRPESEMKTLPVRNAMAKDVVTLNVVETVGNLVRTLETCTHNGFPVVYVDTDQLAGTVERRVLERILKCIRDSSDIIAVSRVSSDTPRRSESFIPFERMQFLRGKYNPSELTEEEKSKVVNLKPYINRNGYMIAEHASLYSCYSFFRALGLRHLPVVGRGGNVCGLVTRKDLILAEDVVEVERLAQKDRGSGSDSSSCGESTDDSVREARRLVTD